MKHIITLFVSAAVILVGCFQDEAEAGAYLNSAHANSTYGVARSSITSLGYAKGNCAHCHEQHASINGNEPAPDGDAPSKSLLFYDNYISQTDGFCLKCHTDIGSVQPAGIVNRSYSYRAGSWTVDPLNDVKEAFAFTTSTSYPSSSSHNLADITTFISNPVRSAWNYNALSNPCAACHDPHVVQGDPANSAFGTKNGSGGWMLVRPSQHLTTPVSIWGDVAAEKMFNYTASYQAPYRFGGVASGYEPDGSGTTNGSNLTDFNTFCIDCHNNTNTISSTLLVRNLIQIDWSAGAGGDRHGQTSASSAQLISPYANNTAYVMACTDCHEPHGSPNIFLTRPEVNNGTVVVTGVIQNGGGLQWASLCERCHGNTVAIGSAHHALPGGEPCATCHNGGAPPTVYVSCTNCHYHGSSATVGGTTYRTF